MADVIPMTKEIKTIMELSKLEARRDEIIGFNKDIENQLNQIVAANKKLQEDFSKLVDQAKVNNGALSEINSFIEAIKKNETTEDTPVEDKKSKKKK
jgi:hypothetical protein